MSHIKRKTDLILKRVYYNENNEITHFIYWDDARQQHYRLNFDKYIQSFKDVFIFRNVYIVNDTYFRARTHKDIGSFEKVGGPIDGTTNTNSTQIEQKDENRSFNTRRCGKISGGVIRKNGTEHTFECGGTDSTSLLQRQLRNSNTESANTCPIIRYVKQAERISPKVFKGCFNNARKHLDEELRWFVTPRNMKDLNGFDCLSFRDNNNYPMGFVAVNAKTGDIGSLLRDKICEMPNFTRNALANAVMLGGTKLDCYSYEDKGLAFIYAKNGFMPVCKVKFDPEFADRTWKPEMGMPDIIFFMLIEVGGSPKSYIDTYVNKIQMNLYANYADYTYVPYVNDLPNLYKESGASNDYEAAEYIRDKILKRWRSIDNKKYVGRETIYIQEIIRKLEDT